MEKSFKEKRMAGRARARVAIEVLHDNFAGIITETCDISENGSLLVKGTGMEKLETGMEFDIKITGLMGQAPKIVAVKVVRVDEKGVALQFKEHLTS